MSAGPALVLDGVRRRYGARTVLDGISLTLERGATLVVFGPNGAGKSTLLRVLATLLRPHGGSLSVLGHRLPGERREARGRVGYLGHEPLLYRDLTARENLAYYGRLYGVAPGRAGELLERVELTERADEPLHTYSRGMVQRVAAARAILHDPELLLLDEPAANLDPRAAALLAPLTGPGGGRTRVVTSHDPSGGLKDADLALGLRGGRAVLLAAAAETDAEQIGALYR